MTMANTVEFKYAPMFQLGEDKTEYRLLTSTRKWRVTCPVRASDSQLGK